MTGPASRRGFLRGLTTLPLIGGGVALIGTPSAVAEPVTDHLLTHYIGFVSREYRDLLLECERRSSERHVQNEIRKGRTGRPGYVAECIARSERNLAWLEHPWMTAMGRTRVEASPSTRAALVLSVVGCDWSASSP